jgi:hypothetical protein
LIHRLIHASKYSRGTAAEACLPRLLIAVSSAAAVATTATAAATAVATTTAATATTATAFARTSFVDNDLTTIQVRSIESANGFITTRLHFHKSKSLGSARVSVTDDLSGSYYAILTESLLETFRRSRPRETTNKNILAHH